MEAVSGGGGVLVSNNCFFYNKTQQHHFWNFILMTQCKLRARRRRWQSRKRGRRWADGADVVFTDTEPHPPSLLPLLTVTPALNG